MLLNCKAPTIETAVQLGLALSFEHPMLQAQFSTSGMQGGSAGVLALAKSPYLHEDLQRDGNAYAHKRGILKRFGC